MSFRAKFHHAVQQMDALEQEMDAWIATQPYTVAQREEPQTGERIVTALVREEPPARWSLMCGDCLFNYRSALDHLAYELAERCTGSPLPDGTAQDSQFPIWGWSAPSAKSVRKRIGGIHPDGQAIIEALQPHHRGNPGFKRDPLWILDRLNNLDKHRSLHLVLPAKAGIGINVIAGSITNTYFCSGPLRHGAEVLRFTALPDSEGNAQVAFHLPYFISFTEDSPAFGEPVIRTLQSIRDRIANDVFSPLARFLR